MTSTAASSGGDARNYNLAGVLHGPHDSASPISIGPPRWLPRHCPGGPAGSVRQLSSLYRAKAREMLLTIRNAIQETYYDPTFRGLDVAGHFKAAEQNSSRLRPRRWRMPSSRRRSSSSATHTPISYRRKARRCSSRVADGDDRRRLLRQAVKPGSDAEAKGLKAGDRLRQVELFTPTRRDLWKIRYFYNLVSPRRVTEDRGRSPGGPPRPLEIAATMTKKPATPFASTSRVSSKETS